MITKERLLRGLSIMLLGSATILVYFYPRLIIIGPLTLAGGALFLLSFYKKRPANNITVTNFINVFTHFRVTLDSDTNVFQALNAMLEITTGALYEHIETLVASLETDHTITPFIAFAQPFKHRFVTHIMINIYMLINHGLDPKRLWQFNYMFETLVKEYNESRLAAHQNSYERFDIMLFVGNALMIFTLMSSVMGMIGGL